jgi:hypothetical protein
MTFLEKKYDLSNLLPTKINVFRLFLDFFKFCFFNQSKISQLQLQFLYTRLSFPALSKIKYF